MGEDLENKINKMIQEIQTLDERLVKFKEFVSQLEENSDHFTRDEIDLANNHSRMLEEECKGRRESLAAKIEIYDNKIVKLSKTIEIRQKIIEDFEHSGAFGEQDDIFNTLAKNHAKLTEEYSEAQQLLET